MPDNTILNPGVGGDTIATDEISGVKFQRVKVVLGADGVNDGDVSSSNAMPVSMASVPSHPVTNAGTFAVQENGAALTALQLIDDGVATTGSAIPSKAMAAAGTDGTNARILKTDTNGELQVDVLTLPATPAGTNYIGKHNISDGTNDLTVDTVHGDAESNTENHIDVGAKLMGFNGTSWDRLRSDITNGLDVDVTRLPSNTVAGASSLPAGTNNIGDVDVLTLPSLPAGTNNIGDVDVLTLPSIPAGSNLIGSVNLQTNTGNGWTNFNATSGDGSTALTNTAQAVKASAGKVGGWYIYNPNAAVAYVIIYNVAAASVTVGTTNPLMVIPVPPLAAANLEITHGINFSTAISIAATSTAAGNGAPTTALDVNLFYS